jgi:hypothetical protein
MRRVGHTQFLKCPRNRTLHRSAFGQIADDLSISYSEGGVLDQTLQ